MNRAHLSRPTRVAFSHWEGRIAPLFDTAREIRVVEADGARLVAARDDVLPAGPVERRAARLAALGVGTLVCGAISRETGRAVEAAGVRVVPFVSGEIGAVVSAFLGGELARKNFRMPGCGGGRRRHVAGPVKGERNMPRKDGTGPTGAGPMTGRGAGPCGGGAAGGGLGRGFGRGRGGGFGRGFGAGPGGGARLRLRRGLGASNAPGDAVPSAAPTDEAALRERLEALRQEVSCLEQGIEAIGREAAKR